MVDTIVIALASFFLNPVVYIGLLVLFFIAHKRVKLERESFHTRVYARRADFLFSIIPSFVAGVLISIATVAVGTLLPIDVVVAIGVATLLLLVTGQMQLVTPTYLFLLVGLYLVLVPQVIAVPNIDDSMRAPFIFPTILFIMTVCLLAQAVLIRKNGLKFVSPQLEKGKRGRYVGIHKINRLWIIPVVFLIPDGIVSLPWSWPLFTVGNMALQPVLFPIILGFKLQTRNQMHRRTDQHTRTYLLLAIVAAVSTIIVTFYPNAWLFASVIGLMGLLHFTLQLSIGQKAKKDPAFFTEEEESCRVVGVLPHSPAGKMNILIGEELTKVNGMIVFDETTLYQALQKNAVYCKIEVKDKDGEKRFVQGPLYNGEHYQLGVLLVRKQEKLSNSII